MVRHNARLSSIAAHVVPAAAGTDVEAVSKVLMDDTMNKNLMEMEYAVRGELVIKAGRYLLHSTDLISWQIDLFFGPSSVWGSCWFRRRCSMQVVVRRSRYQKMLASGDTSLPFDEVILCNIGNPQSVGQKPFTFFRQVLAGCMYPDLVDSGALPADAAARVKKILSGMAGGVGAYSGSKGVDSIRESVADYIQRRDGGERQDIENIFLTSGASEGIKTIMQLATRDGSDGILIPTPQYPLYSATVTAIGGAPVGYSLIEKTGWKLDPKEITALCAQARKDGITPRCLVRPEANLSPLSPCCRNFGSTLPSAHHVS
jgi:hypothetical protein